MLAFVYLATAIYLGDRLCRRFYRFVSLPHRWAVALVAGLLVASWFTYLVGLAFKSAAHPLVWGNLFFFAAVVAARYLLKWRAKNAGDPRPLTRPKGSDAIDWLVLLAYLGMATWMMFASLNSSGGNLLIANNEFSDFGPNTAIIQSFARGHNFPTEYPHFSGERIRYHFLFYFLAGNLEFLGLDPAWGLNLLSILSLVAMLALVMVLGEVLFHSRAVGRLGSALFFFFGSLSYIPFLHRQGSLSQALLTIRLQREFLPSIFPYRGELWGVWSQVTFLNQRHLASAIALFLLVLIFLVLHYRDANPARVGVPPARSARLTKSELTASETSPNLLPGFIFSGVLLGLLPMWNSAVFIAAFAVLAVLFLLFPLRLQMVELAVAAGVIAFPQVIYLGTGGGRSPSPDLFHWGYTIENPTIWKVAQYLEFTFGFKLLLVVLALVLASGLQRRFFAAIFSLVIIAFAFQLTTEVLANQKFLHIWIIIANLFVAYGLWRLWRMPIAGTRWPARIAALFLILAIGPGGIIDLFPIHNAYWTQTPFRNDPLIEWLTRETKPRDVFLTDRFVIHPILMAGRRVFYGWPYYAWSAGYDASERDRVYQELFESKDPLKVFDLLKANHISYVAFDNAIRHGDFIKRPNEQIYAEYFPKVFQGEGGAYNSLIIYKVPEKMPPQLSALPPAASSMFEGGKGSAPGQFDFPRGIAVDRQGNFFVADTNNNRIQKFSATGRFLSIIGMKGTGFGQFGEPDGIAIDRSGNIYVAEAFNHRVQKLTPGGSYLAEWRGPDPGFYGPRKLALGPDQSLYVVDQGRNRIVRLDSDGKALATWGRKGNKDGEFDDPTSVAIDPLSNTVYVADPRNSRIQLFDPAGKFLRNWSVPEWGQPYGFEDLAVDFANRRLFASSAKMDSIMVFALNGNRIGALRLNAPDQLEGIGSLVFFQKKLYALSTYGNRVIRITP